MTTSTPFRSGYAAVAGLPNVGKSTLVNAAIGERIAIVTAKPQTTRRRLLGILSRTDAQVIFTDTPGLCVDAKALHRFLNLEIDRAFADADVVIAVFDPRASDAEQEARVLEKVRLGAKPTLLVVNKTDMVKDKGSLLPRIADLSAAARFDEVFCVSALKGDGVTEVIEATVARMPEGPAYYPEDDLTTADMRFLAAEMIREQVFLQTGKEIPYSTAVVVNTYREPDGDRPIYIEAEIVVERDGQKGIVIGARGSKLRAIGIAARENLEAFVGHPIYLELFVKVRANWSRDERMLQKLGYV
ncbi:MAG: GTPase Era [Deltaproteobacteria bacterium]|nr:GTPase Era [Deltaproteobacteria bacterium]